MKTLSISIILYLIPALFIQNTCPFGAAGKSSIVPKCGHCSMMRHCSRAPEGQKKPADNKPQRFPLFIFTVADAKPLFRLDRHIRPEPRQQVDCKEPFPAELLKPPRLFG
jgi:hypothetical protein